MIHCLHGAVGSFRDWNTLARSFPKEINAIDLWRFFDQGKPTLIEAGEMIAARAKQNDVLLGYSMGGRLALHALLEAPSKWKAAIIVSAHPGLTEQRDERLLADQEWADLCRRNWQTFLRKWNSQGILGTLPSGLHQAAEQDQGPVAGSFQSWSLGAQEDLRPRLAKLNLPVLWLTGEADSRFTDLAHEVVPLIPGAKHQIIAESGHRVPWEQPDLFGAEVENFLATMRR
ncbi:MAG: alpha/beta fold hydrolase [Akkermansiaceae bacterium]|jgi:2-succinyl-6-hydroxy-2,4-cyclohexadiene-1-carboxylate synthase